MVQMKSQQRNYTIVLLLASGKYKTVVVRAASREVAEARAIKHNDSAVAAIPAPGQD